jgi:peroxiredoxin
VKKGDAAPDFSLRDQDGNLVRLSDRVYPGKERSWRPKQVVLLDFFATDCKACREELPQVVELARRRKDIQVLLVAIPEAEDGKKKLDDFFQRNPVPFPILVDAYQTVARKFVAGKDHSVTLPALFLIGKSGRIRALWMGLEKDLLSQVEKILPPATPAAP